jgi:rubrerythrin
MVNVFTAGEIVELGIQVEKNGRDFYDALARQSKGQEAIGIYKYLMGEEERHIVVFQTILDKVSRYEPRQAYPEEYFAYMNALAGDYVFTQKGKGKELAQNTKSDKEAVDLGIGFEKDSILFYEGMKKVTPEGDIRIIDELIAQEQNHLRQLIELRSLL